ncbi:MAG: diaminopimelate epimerase [Thiotrichales bacterium]
MQLRFTKMQGIGNDFVVIDAIHQTVELTPARARRIADRRYGIGCDQILLVEPAGAADAAFRYRIFNADGSEVGQCGNGARCFARFVHDYGLTRASEIPVETRGGRLILRLRDQGQVEVDMGAPLFLPERIPFLAEAESIVYSVDVDGEAIELSALSMGNPHAVILVTDVATAPVERLGPRLESHPRFPQRVNVGFMQVLDPQHIKLRVFERGAGETLACGSGACAAVVAGHQRGLLASAVRVDLPGGTLHIVWNGDQQPVLMTGPAESVFEGTIDL